MEKHKCKLCFRNFANGKALGGHMRSHMMNLPIPPKRNESPPLPPATQLSFEAESASSPSSSSYVLRDNPKRSFRFTDSEFLDVGSVILMDRESETESSKNLTGRRSKRVRKPNEYASSNSNSETTTTEEEDIAFCLIMMSQDNKWNNNRSQEQEEDEEDEDEERYEEEDEDEEESDDESEEVKVKGCKGNTRVRGRYKCDTCNKMFRSYQALGGHRASHKKIKIVKEEKEPQPVFANFENSSSVVVPLLKKIHECPVCLRVFGSGQALGGHKRTHVIGSVATANVTAATATATTTEVRNSVSFIDLNLPAPMDDDDDDDDSAVSDAEFVKPR